MARSESRIRVRKEGGITSINFVDRNILDESTIKQIGEEVSSLIEIEAKPRLLISFSNVDHLSSMALGELITFHNKIKAKGGQLRLAEIDPNLHEVFVITKLTRLFEIHETSAAALASFA